jgi:predicted phage terminase large subunit-like protein
MLKEDNKQTKGWVKKRYSAITDGGLPLWPEKHSLEDLDELRDAMGDLRFSQEMLNLPLSSENPAIRAEWIQYTDSVPDRFDLECVTACDPAFSEKTESDFSAIVTVGACTSGANRGKIYVVDRERGHWSPSDTCKTMVAQATRWKSDVGVMEGVAGAVAMIDLLAHEKRRRNVNFTTKLVKPSRLKDKVSRAQMVAHLFEKGRVYFKKSQRDIVTELLLLPNGEHDDMADALIWALIEVNNAIIKPMNRPKRVAKAPDYVDADTGY